MARKPDLGARELEILKVLWDRGSSSVREVLDELHATDTSVKPRRRGNLNFIGSVS